MDLRTFIIIILWLWGVCFLVSIFIITYLLGRFSIKDNPQKALVFVKTGRHISNPFKANMKGKPSRKGTRYKYGDNIVLVPTSYGDYYYRNKRLIYINRVGQIVALPFDDDTKLADDEKNELIYELVESHIGADAMRELKGHSAMNVIIIAVVSFILGAIIIFGAIQFQKVMEQNKAQQAIQTEQLLPTPIQVK